MIVKVGLVIKVLCIDVHTTWSGVDIVVPVDGFLYCVCNLSDSNVR